MVKMSPETRERISTVMSIAKTTYKYGFIPYIIYLGFKKGADEGMPDLTLLSLLWG